MQRHGNVVSEGRIVERVDGDEKRRVDEPTRQGDGSLSEVEVAQALGDVQLPGEGAERGQEELDRRDEGAGPRRLFDDGFEGKDICAAAPEDQADHEGDRAKVWNESVGDCKHRVAGITRTRRGATPRLNFACHGPAVRQTRRISALGGELLARGAGQGVGPGGLGHGDGGGSEGCGAKFHHLSVTRPTRSGPKSGAYRRITALP